MNAHNCFPESWIGKEPVKVGDGSTYFIDNDSSKQINLPSNYKGLRAVWLNNGVLRIDTNMNNTKLFYVGYQRYFEAYQNETEPHDQYAYNEAVKECQRLRAEEAERNNPKRDSGSIDRKNKSENYSKSSGAGFGLGAMIGSAVSAVKDFRSIDDSSFLENYSYDNLLERRMAEAEQRYKEASKQHDRLREQIDKEKERLRIIEQRIKAKENKKKIFSDLNKVFEEATIIPDKFLCSYLEINSPQQKVAISNVLRGFNFSIVQLGPSEKFFYCWSEIIYLVEEGFLFEEKHVDEISKLISIACGKEETISGSFSSFDDYLKACYSESKYAYWGYDFEEDPEEKIILDRLKYLERHLFFEPDEYYKDYDYYKKIVDDYENKMAIDKRGDTKNEEVEKTFVDDNIEDDIIKVDDKEGKETEKSEVREQKDMSSTKYEDLECTEFKKDNSKEDYKEPKNAFDLFGKSKNKKISNKKEKWNEAMWNLDHKLKKNVLRDLIKIEKDVVKLLKLEEELRVLLDSGKSEGFLGFGGDKNVKKKKSDIKDIKERIVEHKEKLEDSVEELHDCEEDIKDLQEDLYELTGLEKYANFKPLEGKGIGIANQLIKSIKDTDSQTLKGLFEL
jgi:hypothetical protein